MYRYIEEKKYITNSGQMLPIAVKKKSGHKMLSVSFIKCNVREQPEQGSPCFNIVYNIVLCKYS